MTDIVRFKFTPQPDITVQELAHMISKVVNGGDWWTFSELWDDIPPAERRHFTLQPEIIIEPEPTAKRPWWKRWR